MTVDLSVVVVNYRSAEYVLGLVDTVLNDAFTVDGRRGTVDITIVDNASSGDDIARLLPILQPNVRLVRNGPPKVPPN